MGCLRPEWAESSFLRPEWAESCFYRPNGPALWMPGRRSPPVAERPNSSSGPNGPTV